MNLNFRSVFNEATGTWVAVPEIAAAKGKKSRRAVVAVAVALAAIPLSETVEAQVIIGSGDTATNSRTAGPSGRLYQAVLNRMTGAGSITDYLGSTSGQSPDAVVIGNKNRAYQGSVVVGYANTAGVNALDTFASYILGVDNSATGAFDTAIGVQNMANAIAAIVIGVANTASGNTAIALGRQSTASGNFSIAQGNVAQATNTGAIALGDSAFASGNS